MILFYLFLWACGAGLYAYLYGRMGLPLKTGRYDEPIAAAYMGGIVWPIGLTALFSIWAWRKGTVRTE